MIFQFTTFEVRKSQLCHQLPISACPKSHVCAYLQVLEGQPSENPYVPFSYMNEGVSEAQEDQLVTCYKTYTNEATHDIVRANKASLPAYESGEGKGAGPRYCPSLFSKVSLRKIWNVKSK